MQVSERESTTGEKNGGVRLDDNMVWITEGVYQMGSDSHYPEERPAHSVAVQGFWIDRFTVTNERFAKFVDATHYVTLAERPVRAENYPGAKPGMLDPASVVFYKPSCRVDLNNHFNWWAYIRGADWRHPEGPESSLDDRQQHPVVHVAYEDVEAYAKWAGKEIPTEAEWEFAARGGIEGATYGWGEQFVPGDRYMANTWQGQFPWQNLCLDGYEGTAPVGQFPPNGYGMFDMIGNVWEWTSDWYAHGHPVGQTCCGNTDHRGGNREHSHDPRMPELRIPRRVIKGGSFLCAPNYCRRYRPAARMAQPIDTATCHVGFRLVVRPKKQGNDDEVIHAEDLEATRLKEPPG